MICGGGVLAEISVLTFRTPVKGNYTGRWHLLQMEDSQAHSFLMISEKGRGMMSSPALLPFP